MKTFLLQSTSECKKIECADSGLDRLRNSLLDRASSRAEFQVFKLELSKRHLAGLSMGRANLKPKEIFNGQWSLLQVEHNCETLINGSRREDEKVRSIVDEAPEDESNLVGKLKGVTRAILSDTKPGQSRT